MPARRAASTFSLTPPIGSTRPVSVISPVMAVSLRTGDAGVERRQRRRHRHAGRRAVLGDRAGRDVDVDAARRGTRPGRCRTPPRAPQISSAPPWPTPASPRRAGRSASGPCRRAAASPRCTARRRRLRSRPGRSRRPAGSSLRACSGENRFRPEQLGQVVAASTVTGSVFAFGERDARPCASRGRASAPAAARRPRACSGLDDVPQRSSSVMTQLLGGQAGLLRAGAAAGSGVAICDLLLLAVAGQPQDLHAVQQRRGESCPACWPW